MKRAAAIVFLIQLLLSACGVVASTEEEAALEAIFIARPLGDQAAAGDGISVEVRGWADRSCRVQSCQFELSSGGSWITIPGGRRGCTVTNQSQVLSGHAEIISTIRTDDVPISGRYRIALTIEVSGENDVFESETLPFDLEKRLF
jgi:hypothetical protein